MLGFFIVPPVIGLICLVTVILYDVFTVYFDKGNPPHE